MTDTHIEGRADPRTVSGGGGAVSEVTDHAKDLTHHAGDEIGTVLDATKQQARGLVQGARSRAADEADSATGRAADALAGTARDLTALASGQGAPDSQAADFVRQAGERVDRVATQLRDRGYQGITEDVSRWARAHPGAFLAAAAGAGFVIGRVFRAADTQGVVDAAKGTPSSADTMRVDEAAALGAGDPSLFAAERRPDASGMAATSPPLDRPIDLTDPATGPVAGV